MAAAATEAAVANGSSGFAAAIPADAEHHQQPFSSQHGLNKDQVERYSRHLLLPSFGVSGQGKLCNSRALIVGCGGLGSPAALYLAAAGVGSLGLVDHDVVELSNMHRQVIHTEDRLGQHKALSAAAAVRALNSSVQVNTYLEGLHPNNAVDIISQYDVVLDASDNPPTRYLISDACVACDVPLVSAAAVGTDGQLTVYHYGPEGPCYRCLFPECPAPANCARCADAGVLGPVPGVLGVLQALEAVKVLSGCGEVMSGRLMLFDALAGRFTTIKLRGRAAGCIACGPQPQITRDSLSSYDYTTFTAGQRANDGPPVPLNVLPPDQRITAQQLQEEMMAAAGTSSSTTAAAAATEPQQQQQQGQAQPLQPHPVLLDVRPPEQFAVMSLPGAISMPFLQFEKHFDRALQLCGVMAPTGQQQGTDTASQQQQQDKPLQQQREAQVVRPAASGVDAAVGAAAGVGNGVGGTSGGAVGRRRVVVMCRRGNHSQLAAQRLRQAGAVDVVDVVGGYEAWAQQVDAGMPVL